MDREVTEDRVLSVRERAVGQWLQWFELHKGESSAPGVLRLDVERTDFPSGVDELRIRNVLLYAIGTDGVTVDVAVERLVLDAEGDTVEVGSARSRGGVISTRRGNGASWVPLIGRSPVGSFELELHAPTKCAGTSRTATLRTCC